MYLCHAFGINANCWFLNVYTFYHYILLNSKPIRASVVCYHEDIYLQTVPVETAIIEVRSWRTKLQALLQQLQSVSKTYLVRN